jgi:hypothetical protein
MAVSISAVDIVKTAFVEALNDPMLSLLTERASIARESAQHFVKLFSKYEVNPEFSAFCQNWIGMLQNKIRACNNLQVLKGRSREKLWRSFYLHRTTELQSIWVEFMLRLKVDSCFYDDPLLIQIVCGRVFESLIKTEFPLPSMTPSSVPAVSTDEKQAICYAAGYVLRSIRLKLSKSSSFANKTIASFIITLHEENDDFEQDDGDCEESYKDWIKKVNRGGLFVIGDHVHETFLAIENVTRKYLKDLHSPLNKTIDVDALFQVILTDDDVRFWWTIVCSTLENDLADILLEQIVKLWITLRGFSLTSAIVEQYKQCTKINPKRKRSLRKDLMEVSNTKHS